MPPIDSLFQDEIITATELNRHAGQVLEKARLRPLTITRNDEAFALVLRSTATRWVEAMNHAIALADLYGAASSVGGKTASQDALSWINAFDSDQVREMMSELTASFRKALVSGNWEEFDATLHEWEESGWAALSPELAEAWRAEAEEVPLTPPSANILAAKG